MFLLWFTLVCEIEVHIAVTLKGISCLHPVTWETFTEVSEQHLVELSAWKGRPYSLLVLLLPILLTFKMEAWNFSEKLVTSRETKLKLNSMVRVRERTIPTEGPPPVGEVIANFLRIEGDTWSA
jgi:hypothetical protein